MKKLKENKAFLIAVSLLAAFVIWLAVDNGTKVPKIISNVAVEYVGEETTLASRGLMLIQGEEPAVLDFLEIQGSRSDIAKLDPAEVKVQVDLSSVNSVGSQNLTYRVIYPTNKLASRLSIKSASSSTISVTVGELYRKNVGIRCDMSGSSVAEGYIAGEVQLEPAELEIWGRQADVMQVSYAKVNLSVEQASATVVQLLEYELYDHNDQLIEDLNIHADRDSIQVTLPVDVVKDLPLELNFEESPGYSSSNVDYRVEPSVIKVSGDAAILGSVDSVVLDTIDLSQLSGTATFRYAIKLPDGCENLSGVTEAVVTIRFRDLTSRELLVTNLSFENAPEGKNVTILSGDLTVTLRGTSADLAAVAASDVKAVADLSSVEDASGNYTVPAVITVETDGNVGVAGSYQLKINLSDSSPDGGEENHE